MISPVFPPNTVIKHFYGSSDYDEEDYYYNEDTDADTDAAAEAIPSAAPDSTDSTDTDNT